MKSISIVVPAYNEEGNINRLFQAIQQTLPEITEDFEIIVVDDASLDRTPFILDELALSDKRIKVVHNKKNRRLGGSLKEGFKQASKELILYLDADLPFDLRKIRKALDILEQMKADFVSAYRINRNADGLRRTIYSYVYNFIIELLFHMHLKDINFSFKVFKKEILDHIELKSEGSFISAELLIRTKLKGFKIAQFPTKYYPRTIGRSMLSGPLDILKILYELIIFYFGFFIKIDKPNKAIDDIRLFYKDSSLFKKAYIYLRLKTCPFEMIENYISPKGKIIDLGCGVGLFSFLMYMKSNKREITAIDWIESRINFAKTLCGNNTKINFLLGDITQFSWDGSENIILIDVLYLLSYEKQKELLFRCFQALNPNGTLIIKEMDTSPLLKYIWCLIQEFFVTKIFRANLSTGLYFRNKGDLIRLLGKVGFDTEVVRLDKGYLYPHILYICKNEES